MLNIVKKLNNLCDNLNESAGFIFYNYFNKKNKDKEDNLYIDKKVDWKRSQAQKKAWITKRFQKMYGIHRYYRGNKCLYDNNFYKT